MMRTHISVRDLMNDKFTVTIRLSTCPLKYTILLSAHSIEVKIQIKKFTLFHDEITSNQIGTMFLTPKNNKMSF